jgi:hypothetical protein
MEVSLKLADPGATCTSPISGQVLVDGLNKDVIMGVIETWISA